MAQEGLAKDPITDYPGELEVNQLIYVRKSEKDEVTLDNMEDPEKPEMVTQQLDLFFDVDNDKYDPEKNVKVRVNSSKDWGRVDWTTGQLIDKDAEPVEVDKVILNIHGGSFNRGCSGNNMIFTKKYSQELDCPVFSIDYRLAPKTKFPGGLSDCFHVFLWLTHYAENTLQLKFKKIIIEADSAGGNIGLAMTNLLIMKDLNVPTGLCLSYPATNLNRASFSPSTILAIDDLMLNFHYLPMVLNMYLTQKYEQHYLASVKETPESILKKYPPVKFIIGENDPLRDDILRMQLKLLKSGVKAESTIFKHCFHGFMGHAVFPEELPIKPIAVDKITSELTSF